MNFKFLTSNSGIFLITVFILMQGSKAGGMNPVDTPWVNLFNGKDLTGWQDAEGGTETWYATPEGTIAARAGTGSSPDYLVYWGTGTVTPQEFRDFIYEIDVKISEPEGNGGAFYRGNLKNYGHGFGGMQMDAGRGAGHGIDNYWWALFFWNLNRVLFELKDPIPSAECLQTLKPFDWNSFRIEIEGLETKHIMNGVHCLTYDFSQETKGDLNKQSQGSFALQRHNKNETIEYRNPQVVELPLPIDTTPDTTTNITNQHGNQPNLNFIKTPNKTLRLSSFDLQSKNFRIGDGFLLVSDLTGKKSGILLPTSYDEWKLPSGLSSGIYIIQYRGFQRFISQKIVLP